VAEFHWPDHENRGTVRFGPHSVQRRAERAIQIAAIASVSSLTDWLLVLIYGYLMGKSLPKVGKTGLPQRHPVAHHIFERVHSLELRHRLMLELAKTEAEADEYKALEKLLGAVHAANAERSRIVHGVWGICDEPQCAEALILHRRRHEDRGRIYHAHDFQQVYDKLYKIEADAYALMMAIQTRLHLGDNPALMAAARTTT
jgi:hypothetical protein